MEGTLGTILAHPDDETFGTGGTLIRYALEGVHVHSLCLTQGEQGWGGGEGAPEVPRELVGATRVRELAEAGRRMGVASVTCLEYPDGGLAGVDPGLVIRDIVRWLRRVRPDVVITWGPDGGYGHPDHIAAGELALRAIALAGDPSHGPELDDALRVKRCYRFVAGAEFVDAWMRIIPEFARYMESLAVKPERWTRDRLGAEIDAAPHIARKLDAMYAHQTQMPDLRMWERVRASEPAALTKELYIRDFPDPGGPPLEDDLFGALRG